MKTALLIALLSLTANARPIREGRRYSEVSQPSIVEEVAPDPIPITITPGPGVCAGSSISHWFQWLGLEVC